MSGSGPLLTGVGAEGPGGGELAQLVPDHRLGDVDGDVLAPVVHGDGVTDHLGDDRGPPGPGLDHGLVVGFVEEVVALLVDVLNRGLLLRFSFDSVTPMIPILTSLPSTFTLLMT